VGVRPLFGDPQKPCVKGVTRGGRERKFAHRENAKRIPCLLSPSERTPCIAVTHFSILGERQRVK